MKKFTVLFFVLFSFSNSFGQLKIGIDDLVKMMGGAIESDRPGQAYSSTTCGFLRLQAISGFHYGMYAPTGQKFTNMEVPFEVRFGLLPRFELNSRFLYADKKFETDSSFLNYENSGFTSPDIGCRIQLIKGEKWKPNVALQSNLSIRSGGGDFQQANYGSSFYLITGNSFSKISVSTNLAMIFPGDNSGKPQFNYVLNLGFPLGDKVSCFIEGYGSLDNPTLYADGGFAFLVSKDLQLDIFGGWLGQNNPDPNWFAEVGISYQVSFLKMVAKKKMKDLNPFD